jgi:hypothetical protein
MYVHTVHKYNLLSFLLKSLKQSSFETEFNNLIWQKDSVLRLAGKANKSRQDQHENQNWIILNVTVAVNLFEHQCLHILSRLSHLSLSLSHTHTLSLSRSHSHTLSIPLFSSSPTCPKCNKRQFTNLHLHLIALMAAWCSGHRLSSWNRRSWVWISVCV